MIDIDLSLLAELISVLVLMAVLNSILFRPIRKQLEEREAKMAAIEAEVERFEHRAQKLVEDFDMKMAEARTAGKQELERLKEEGREEERQLAEASAKEASAKKEELMSDISGQIEAARKELKDQSETFALEIAQKLLGRAV
jgi:F-type H+-transporting ATPase subunit b